MAFRFGQRRARRWSFAVAAVAAASLTTLFMAGTSGAVVTGSPSGFESSDGNMTVEGTNAGDWNCFANGAAPGFASGVNTGPGSCSSALVPGNAVAIHPDANNGANGEVTWKAGQKLDANCPVLDNNGSVPNKDDFTGIASYNETDSAHPPNTFLYGAEIRDVANGSSSGNLELSQSAGTSACPINRTAGDRLLAFDFTGGGTVLNFHALTWITPADPTAGGNNGICEISHDSPPCWGANVISSSTGITVGGCNTTNNDVEGCSNQSAIAAGDNGIDKTALVANQFAEFGVNLTKVLGLTGCSAFTQETWESRSSGSSFTSNPEDIELEHHPIENCGEIKIIKQTDPRGHDKVFSFSSNLPQQSSAGGVACPGNSGGGIQADGSFCLNDAGNAGKTLGSTDPAQNSTGNTVDTGQTVFQGSYTVSEGTEPGGFTFESITCTADTASGSSVTTSGKTATITLKPEGLVTCLYVNQLNTATMATQVSNAGPVFPSVPVHDTATVTGNQTADTPSGTVTFFLCGPIATGACDGTTNVGTNIGTGSLSGTGASASAPSPDVNTAAMPLTPGRYCFRAEWPGDNNYPTPLTEFGGANGTNECFTVQKIPTTTTTTPSTGSGGTTTFGSSVTDHAIVQANQTGDGTPTGTVTFFICDPTQTVGGACPDGQGSQVGSPVTTQAVTGSSPPASSADSIGVTVNKTGTWCFRAVYTPGGANGSNYTGSEDASSGECFTVTDTTASTSAQTWLPNDTGTVTSAHGAPLNGTLSMQLFTDGACGAAGGTAVSGQLYSTTLSNAASPATLTTNNKTFTVSASTSVSWLVTFTSSDNNVSSSSTCESTSLTINN